MTLRWLIGTPLGRPVVPLVKRITTGSSSCEETSGSDAPAPAASSSPTVSSSGHTGEPRSNGASRSMRRRSANTTRGSVSCTAYASSGPVHQPLSPTVVAPSAVTAQNKRAYSTRLAAAIAMRSPGRTSKRILMPLATWATAVTTDSNVSVRSGKTRYGRSAYRSAPVSSTSTTDLGRCLKTRNAKPNRSSSMSSKGPPGPSSGSPASPGRSSPDQVSLCSPCRSVSVGDGIAHDPEALSSCDWTRHAALPSA